MKHIQINLNAKDTSAEELKKLYDILNPPKEKRSSQKHVKLYLLNSDIEAINERYDELFKKVKNSLDLTPKQIDKECDILSAKYDFEIEELSRLRKVEYLNRQAKIEARLNAEAPWRRCWLWRLLGLPLTNRAQDIIEVEAELNAEDFFKPLEQMNEKRAEALFGADGNKLSKRKRSRIYKKYLEYKILLAKDHADDVHVEDVAEPSEASTAAPGANDAAHQNADTGKSADIIEPPAPPARQPRKGNTGNVDAMMHTENADTGDAMMHTGTQATSN